MHRVETSKLLSVRPPTFAAARAHVRTCVPSCVLPHREVGSDSRLLASSRAIPSGAVTLRSLPLSQSGCPSLLGPCLLVVQTTRSRPPPDGGDEEAAATSRLHSVTESVAVLRREPMASPILPWASCSFSNRGRGSRPSRQSQSMRPESHRILLLRLRPCVAWQAWLVTSAGLENRTTCVPYDSGCLSRFLPKGVLRRGVLP